MKYLKRFLFLCLFFTAWLMCTFFKIKFIGNSEHLKIHFEDFVDTYTIKHSKISWRLNSIESDATAYPQYTRTFKNSMLSTRATVVFKIYSKRTRSWALFYKEHLSTDKRLGGRLRRVQHFTSQHQPKRVRVSKFVSHFHFRNTSVLKVNLQFYSISVKLIICHWGFVFCLCICIFQSILDARHFLLWFFFRCEGKGKKVPSEKGKLLHMLHM